ncbi:MAG TPA: hypothetical protein PLW78_06700, partial [bacterium]|nr:hypothetical protein [bacterium]
TFNKYNDVAVFVKGFKNSELKKLPELSFACIKYTKVSESACTKYTNVAFSATRNLMRVVSKYTS